MKKDYFPELISELCHENGIRLNTLQDGRIRILSLNGEERIIWSKKFEINSVISARIADNKSSTYEVLKQNNIPCVSHKRYMCRYENSSCYLDKDSLQNIYSDLEKYHEVVLKPENGYEGTDVYRCSCVEDISQIFKKFQKPYSYICLSPYYSVKAEYRTVCLNGKALLSYQKTLPFVTGNGKDTVQQLAKQKYNNIDKFSLFNNKDDQIPPCGEKVIIGWKFNLSQGAKSNQIVSPTVLETVQELSIKAACAIHINFSSVDIIETFSGEFLVMEINSGVVLNQFIEDNPKNYAIAKNIYRKAVLSMFGKTTDNLILFVVIQNT